MIEVFDAIVASLTAGHYTRITAPYFDPSNIQGQSHFSELPISDEAELFEEASKTFLYYWCVANNEVRWKDYYESLCIPSDAPDCSLTDIPFQEVVKIISPDAIVDW